MAQDLRKSLVKVFQDVAVTELDTDGRVSKIIKSRLSAADALLKSR